MTRFIKAKSPKDKIVYEHISGNCLERIGIYIPSGGIAIINRNLRPKLGDIVICTKERGTLSQYCKMVKEFRNNSIIVGTAYMERENDFEFEAAEIRGVVLQVFCKIWKKEIYNRRKHLNGLGGKD